MNNLDTTWPHSDHSKILMTLTHSFLYTEGMNTFQHVALNGPVVEKNKEKRSWELNGDDIDRNKEKRLMIN